MQHESWLCGERGHDSIFRLGRKRNGSGLRGPGFAAPRGQGPGLIIISRISGTSEAQLLNDRIIARAMKVSI